MARLSDFQIPDAPIPVDQKLMARNAKAARTQVDWKKTRTSATDLALQPYQTFLMDAGSNIDIEEPEESDSNEEPESDSDEEPTEAQARDALQNFLTVLKDSGVTIKTSAKKVAVDRGAATVILPRREAKAIAGYITDSDYISKFLDPNELCVTAENRLHNLTYEAQVNNANRGYFSGLFYFLKSQPAGTRVRDVQNKACLSTLLANTLGGRPIVFGA